MKLLAASALLALMTVSLRAEDDPKKALESLQGEWKVVEFIRNGNADKKDATIAFDGSKMSIAAEKKTESMTISLDPKANPPAMDIKVSEGGKDLTIKAIYKLEKDKLSICFALDGKERPKEFKSEKDSKQGLFVLERVKK